MRNEAIFDLDDFNASALDRRGGTVDGHAPAARPSLSLRLAGWFSASAEAWREGRRRRRDHALLMQLSDHHLKDIGLSRGVTGAAMRHGRSALDRL